MLLALHHLLHVFAQAALQLGDVRRVRLLLGVERRGEGAVLRRKRCNALLQARNALGFKAVGMTCMACGRLCGCRCHQQGMGVQW